MITAWLFTVIEEQLRKVIPAAIELFLVPTLTLLIGAAASIFIIMPVSSLLMKGLTWLLVDFALAKGGTIGGFILATFFLSMAMLGIHQGLTPIHAQLIANRGFTELLPILAMAGAGQVGMAIAILLKTKIPRLRSVIKSALPIGILGIENPSSMASPCRCSTRSSPPVSVADSEEPSWPGACSTPRSSGPRPSACQACSWLR